MSFIRHLLIAIGYSVVAAAVALVLPNVVPAIASDMAVMLGAVVLIASALLHEVFARQEEEGRLAEEIYDLRASHGEVLEELSRARDEVRNIFGAIETMTAKRSGKALEEDMGKVMAEVKMLQGLVEQLTSAGHAGAIQPASVAVAGGGAVPYAAPPQALDDSFVVHIVREGIAKDRVDLVLQPIVSLPQRKRRFYEAYTRIRDDKGEVFRPEQYIAIAEREGLVTALDNLMLFRCVQMLRKKHLREGNIGFFCNISPHTLSDRKFFNEFVMFMTENSKLAPSLVFEFTHATIANQDDEIRRQLARLAALGFRFSLDQVATLNLDYGALARQHFKYVKIDVQTLLRELPQPSTDIDLQDYKKALERQGIDLVVEKIETEKQLLEVLDFHVDYGQGYLFGEPREGVI